MFVFVTDRFNKKIYCEYIPCGLEQTAREAHDHSLEAQHAYSLRELSTKYVLFFFAVSNRFKKKYSLIWPQVGLHRDVMTVCSNYLQV